MWELQFFVAIRVFVPAAFQPYIFFFFYLVPFPPFFPLHFSFLEKLGFPFCPHRRLPATLMIDTRPSCARYASLSPTCGSPTNPSAPCRSMKYLLCAVYFSHKNIVFMILMTTYDRPTSRITSLRRRSDQLIFADQLFHYKYVGTVVCTSRQLNFVSSVYSRPPSP